MSKKFKEWLSIQLEKNPGKMVLLVIILFNIVFFFIASAIISTLKVNGTEHLSFIEAAYRTLTMILDAGCIDSVVGEIGQSGVALCIICLLVALIGMISFTGAVIGYISNYISSFIQNANSGNKKLNISNHFVILNWNTRASEIVNDMLYCDRKQKVVILVPSRKEEVEKEIEERLLDTISRENRQVYEKIKHLPFIRRLFAYRRNRFKGKVMFIVREGDVFSSKQLADISLKKARSVIILGNNENNYVCRFERKEVLEEASRGNSHTVKTLMQVADITSAEDSFDGQRIIVEITDEWTMALVEKIIQTKQVKGKCNIIPIKINDVLGQLFSQFCLMPELNAVYSELFSSKGAEFYSAEEEEKDEVKFVENYLKEHNHALAITTMEIDDKNYGFYVAENEKDLYKKSNVEPLNYSVNLNKNYWIEKKNIIILGHNTRIESIMNGFEGFSQEWRKDGKEIVKIVVVDDKESLEKMNYYKQYPFVIRTVEADVFDKELIRESIENFVDENEEDTSVLILSDDTVAKENIDAGALTNLVYVHDIVLRRIREQENFDPESIDVIVEIIDPKHYDIVKGYSANNVVISNRYISKMITQISEVEAIYEFYNDILTYDEEGATEYGSKEIYVKKVSRYFDSVPEKTTADKFVRAVYEQTSNSKEKGEYNPTIVLGYVKPGGIVKIFSGDLSKIEVDLTIHDKIIVFSPH